MQDLFHIKIREHNYRNALKIELPRFNTITYGKSTLHFNGAKLYNSLGNEFKNARTFTEFNAKLKTWYGERCLCNNCKYYTMMLL